MPAGLGRSISQSAQIDEWMRRLTRDPWKLFLEIRQPLAAKLLDALKTWASIKMSTLFAPPTGLTRWLSSFPIATLFPKKQHRADSQVQIYSMRC